jgi:hypothetical protein
MFEQDRMGFRLSCIASVLHRLRSCDVSMPRPALIPQTVAQNWVSKVF